MNIYIGNLSYEVTNSDLQEAFQLFGQVTSANVISDRRSGKSRGFGFVEMPNKAEALIAISTLNGTDLKRETISVSEARPRRTKGPAAGNRGRGGG